MSNNIKPIIIGMILGGIFTFGATYFFAPSGSDPIANATTTE
jgi:Cu(I)/Ag(I) efflux system membrane fusion protein